MRRVLMGLLIVVVFSVAVSYWLIFVQITNDGLTFENKLRIPEQLFGTLVDGRRQS